MPGEIKMKTEVSDGECFHNIDRLSSPLSLTECILHLQTEMQFQTELKSFTISATSQQPAGGKDQHAAAPELRGGRGDG